MIEKNKFKEKILSEHTSSADMKVLLPLMFSCRFAYAKGPSSKNNNRMVKSTLSLVQILKSKYMNLSFEWTVLPNLFKIIHLHLITHSTKNK